MRILKVFVFLTLSILFTSCQSLFKPYGSWITEQSKHTFQVRKAPDDNIRIRYLDNPNSEYFTYNPVSQTDTDTLLRFTKSARAQIDVQSVGFRTQDKAYFEYESKLNLAYRTSKKEEPSPEILNEAIAREVRRKTPIRVVNWNSGRINNESHRFENVTVSLSQNGNLSISGRQTVNSCVGFTGKVIAKIMDDKGNVFVQYDFNAHGLNPKLFCRKNTRGYNYTVSLRNQMTDIEFAEMLIGATRIELIAVRSKSSGRFQKFTSELAKVTKNISDIGGDVAKIAGYF